MLYKRKKKIDFWKGVIIFVAGEIGVILGLRFFLIFVSADLSNGFAKGVMEITNPLVGPFEGIFKISELVGSTGVEFYTLFAIAIYVLLAFALIAFVGLFEK